MIGRRRAGFWMSAAAGWLIVGYGMRGLLHHRVDTRPANLGRFVIGGALVHDLVLAPAVLLVGVAVSRAVHGPLRAVVQGALLVSGMFVLFSWPLVRDYARVLHNPSSLPHNYTANLVTALAVVWAVAALCGLVAVRRSRRPVQDAAAVAATSDPKSTGSEPP